MALQRFTQGLSRSPAQRKWCMSLCTAVGAPAEQPADFGDPKEAIMKAALQHVRELGWSEAALARGSVDIGFPAVAHGMFPNGGAHLVEYVMADATKAMSAHMATLDMTDMTVNERIKAGMAARLAHLEPMLPSLPAAMAVAAATPQHLPAIVHQAGVFADELWFCAGDDSTSIEWYTRRGLLVLINGLTELHMVQDSSPGHADTWAFLDRRLADAQELGKGGYEALAVLGAAGAGLGSIVETGLRLLMPITSAAATGPASGVATVMTVATAVMQQAAPLVSGAVASRAPAPPSQAAPAAEAGVATPPTEAR